MRVFTETGKKYGDLIGRIGYTNGRGSLMEKTYSLGIKGVSVSIPGWYMPVVLMIKDKPTIG